MALTRVRSPGARPCDLDTGGGASYEPGPGERPVRGRERAMIIAIDGPAASGKGTIARRLAALYGLPHLDTGLLYRAVAAALLGAGRDLYDESAAVAAARGLGLTDFDEDLLRSRNMGEAAIVGGKLAEVESAQQQLDLVRQQIAAIDTK